jgi:hypothetical protein
MCSEEQRRIEDWIARKPPEEVSLFVDSVARPILAFAAGASLLIPAVVMSLGKNVPKSLITTSLAGMLFAVCLAFGVKGYVQRLWLLLLLMCLFDFVCEAQWALSG